MSFLKKLFCDHVFKTIKTIEKLGTYEQYSIWTKTWNRVDKYFVEQECLKCEKKQKIVERYDSK